MSEVFYCQFTELDLFWIGNGQTPKVFEQMSAMSYIVKESQYGSVQNSSVWNRFDTC